MSEWLKGFLTGVVVIVIVTAVQPAYADHAWGQHFSARTIAVQNEMGTGGRVLRRALNAWEPIGVTFTLRKSPGPKCDPPEVNQQADYTIRVCRSTSYDTAWATTNTVTGGHYTAGLVGVNPYYLRLEDNRYLRYVLCQEIGHTLGLDHDDNDGSCMSDTNFPRPSQHDIEALTAVYTHVD